MATEVAFIGVAVADYPSALAWYERLMGRRPDMIPNGNEAVWQLSEKGWMYLIGDAQRAGKALLTLIVDNLDGHISEFNERGISFEVSRENVEIYRRVVLTDPEGNTFNFTELVSGDGQARAV